MLAIVRWQCLLGLLLLGKICTDTLRLHLQASVVHQQLLLLVYLDLVLLL